MVQLTSDNGRAARSESSSTVEMLFTVFMVFHHLLSKLLLLPELTEVVNDDQTLQLLSSTCDCIFRFTRAILPSSSLPTHLFPSRLLIDPAVSSLPRDAVTFL